MVTKCEKTHFKSLLQCMILNERFAYTPTAEPSFGWIDMDCAPNPTDNSKANN